MFKKRMHLDVPVGTATDALDPTARLVELGGTKLQEFDDFIVMADPEGAELCLEFDV